MSGSTKEGRAVSVDPALEGWQFIFLDKGRVLADSCKGIVAGEDTGVPGFLEPAGDIGLLPGFIFADGGAGSL